MISVLQNKNRKIRYIVQVGDIHIRQFRRIDEYSTVFDRFFNLIKNLPQEETVVVNTGDTFHSKLELQPEGIRLAEKLFRGITNLFDFIVIPGNHDANIQNKDRLDSVTPIVEMLGLPNLFYLKKSELYAYENILINNYSIFDSSEKYLAAKNIPKIYLNQYEHLIALYHGPVDNSLTDLGYKITNKSMPLSIFDGHHIVLLGDIHLNQDLQMFDYTNDKPFVRYQGSFIMQNHGELLKGHGFSLWDLKSKTYKHIEVPNDYGFFTVDIHKGKLVSDLKDIPKKSKIRIKCFESVATEVKAVVSSIRKLSDVQEILYVRIDSPTDKSKLILSNGFDISLEDLSNVEYQNKLISDYLKCNLQVDDKNTIDSVLKINKEINSLIEKNSLAKNIQWKPKRFEWSNMFSYGENNVIDFTKLKGIVGLFAKNASGKTSLGSALSFCLFDKYDKAYKASDVLNVEKMGFDCKFNFLINGIDYFIEKKGVSDKKGNVKVNVKFWKEKDGKEENLSGEERYNTNDIIKEYIGTYEDFALTTLSVQNVKNNNSFIDMGHAERKDLLSQFIGLTIFDKLFEKASFKNKDISVLLREYKNDDFTKKLVDTSNVLKQAISVYDDESNKLIEFNKLREDIQKEIIDASKNLIKTDINVPHISSSLKEKSILNGNITKLSNDIFKLKEESEIKEKEILKVNDSIKNIENKNINFLYKEHQFFINELSSCQNDVEKKKVDVKNKLAKLEKLKEHKYDPNCKFCINNIFVKDAIRTQQELIEDKRVSDELVTSLLSFKEKVLNSLWVKNLYDEYELLIKTRDKIKENYDKIINNLNVYKSNIETEKIKLNVVNENVNIYNSNQKDIETNHLINEKIQQLQKKLNNIEFDIKKKNSTLLDLNSKITLLKKQIADIKERVDKAQTLESNNYFYELYLKSIGRDGIPYDIISRTIPELEREINNILNQIVEFQIKIEVDGKNVLPYIVYNDKKWRLELSSGMERFISSIAIRVALINISCLTKSNFLILDEGWSVIDAENRASLSTLLSFLKTNFDFIIVISHLDELRDLSETSLELNKINGFSKINYI